MRESYARPGSPDNSRPHRHADARQSAFQTAAHRVDVAAASCRMREEFRFERLQWSNGCVLSSAQHQVRQHQSACAVGLQSESPSRFDQAARGGAMTPRGEESCWKMRGQGLLERPA